MSEDEERALIVQHMEAILVKLGRADMNCERLRLMAATEENPVKKAGMEQMAEMAARRLEMIAHEAIELGRALAVRSQNDAVPLEIPESIRNIGESSYSGAEGMPDGQDPGLLSYSRTPTDSGKSN